jgi:hypothetical protein
MRRIFGAVLLATALLNGGELTLKTVDGTEVQPLNEPSAHSGKAEVFLFTRTDCPISNRYAPEVERLYDAFSSRGFQFWLVYVDPAQTAAAIRAHRKEYGYHCGALLDPKHQLVRATGAEVTPEAVVFSKGRVLYRGRIDDRYVAFGKARQSASTHDLEDVLNALAAGQAVEPRTTRAIGCFIEDLK